MDPDALRSRPLCVVDIRLEDGAPIALGRSPYRNRRVSYIAGGTIEGQRLRGEVLPGGGDWSELGAGADGAALTLIDVRSDREWNAGHAPNAIHVPIGDVNARAAEFDRAGAIATICEGGYRSMLAESMLIRAGFANVLNVAGGMTAYRSSSDT